MSTYLIFNQLQIIHPQFRPKSRSSVLEPSQNFLSSKMCSIVVVRARSKEEAICRRGPHKLWLKRATIRLLNTTGRVSRCLKPTVWTVEQSVSGVLYISTRSSRSGKASRIVDFRVESPLARGSPDAATSSRWDLGRLGDRGTDHPGIFTRKHDRSCLEMSEADGVDSGAICKRGFIHLQFAEKPEAPEAERHLGSWILE
ncbi:hypothetical protein V1477_008901 [Vespula maculifrons]|uniref:Uncharacterized protein n=1 Tax=Vespula maculifrons TaxID=7453 RepID=A0ABD2CEC5_VESMC